MESNHITIDIETIPAPSFSGTVAENYIRKKVPKKITKRDSIRKWIKENNARVYEETALNDMMGEIVCVCVAAGEGDIATFTRPADEKTILAELWQWLKRTPRDRVAWWVGFNLKAFDLPYIRHRALYHGLYELAAMIPWDKWGDSVADVMTMWAGTDFRRMVKLEDVCSFLGIHHVGSGAAVFELYKAGRFDDIARHCEADVWGTREIYQRLTGDIQ